MDLLVRITDENGDELNRVNVYQDGSDSEGANKIVALVAANFQIDGTYLET